MINKMLSIYEASEMLKVSERTVYRMIEQGKIGVIRITPKNLAIPEDDIQNYLLGQYQKNGGNGAE
mgnify:FL=1